MGVRWIGKGLLIVFSASLAGCVDMEDIASAAVPSPEKEVPKSLEVPLSTDGQRSVFTGSSSGHYVDSGHLKSYSRSWRAETQVQSGVKDFDSFLRPVELVLQTTRISGDGEHEDDRYVMAFEQATGDMVYTEYESRWHHSSSSCGPLSCTESEYEFKGPHRHYQTSEVSARFASLEGLTLEIGTTVRFTRESEDHRYYINLTPIREETWNGERAFVVERTAEWISDDEEARTPVHDPEELPDSVDLYWMTESSPEPVRSLIETPLSHGGSIYWSRYERILESHQPGSSPVPWGSGTPLPPLDAAPGADLSPASHFISRSKSGLTYPLAEAWSALESDPLLVGFRDYMERHPTAGVAHATYYPDQERRAFTWEFWIGDTTSDGAVVSTRRQFIENLPFTQNRDAGTATSEPAPMDADWASRPAASFEHALRAYRLFRGEQEPAISLRFATFGFKGQEAAISMYNAQTFESYQGIPTSYESWIGMDSVDVRLKDGGLYGLNSLTVGWNDWLWLLGPPHPSDGSAPPMGLFPALGSDPLPFVSPRR